MVAVLLSSEFQGGNLVTVQRSMEVVAVEGRDDDEEQEEQQNGEQDQKTNTNIRKKPWAT